MRAVLKRALLGMGFWQIGWVEPFAKPIVVVLNNDGYRFAPPIALAQNWPDLQASGRSSGPFPSLRGATATKQSIVAVVAAMNCFACARNDGGPFEKRIGNSRPTLKDGASNAQR
jgi:hypothetical protein